MVWKLKCFDIDYYIGWEDVENNFEVPTDFDDEDLDRWYELKIEEIRVTLPKEVIIEVEADEEDLEDVAVDTLSEETGWLINSFDYTILDAYSTDDDFNEDEFVQEAKRDELTTRIFEEIEIEMEGNEVWLAHNGSSGCHYTFNTKDELKQLIRNYVDDLVDYELKNN